MEQFNVTVKELQILMGFNCYHRAIRGFSSKHSNLKEAFTSPPILKYQTLIVEVDASETSMGAVTQACVVGSLTWVG